MLAWTHGTGSGKLIGHKRETAVWKDLGIKILVMGNIRSRLRCGLLKSKDSLTVQAVI